jgi:hypothetical protein
VPRCFNPLLSRRAGFFDSPASKNGAVSLVRKIIVRDGGKQRGGAWQLWLVPLAAKNSIWFLERRGDSPRLHSLHSPSGLRRRTAARLALLRGGQPIFQGAIDGHRTTEHGNPNDASLRRAGCRLLARSYQMVFKPSRRRPIREVAGEIPRRSRTVTEKKLHIRPAHDRITISPQASAKEAPTR